MHSNPGETAAIPAVTEHGADYVVTVDQRAGHIVDLIDDVADVSLVDGYSNDVQIEVGGTILGPPATEALNEKVFGLYPLGCDICVARQNPPCGTGAPGSVAGCKRGPDPYHPDVPCQWQGGVMGGGSRVEVVLWRTVERDSRADLSKEFSHGQQALRTRTRSATAGQAARTRGCREAGRGVWPRAGHGAEAGARRASWSRQAGGSARGRRQARGGAAGRFQACSDSHERSSVGRRAAGRRRPRAGTAGAPFRGVPGEGVRPSRPEHA